VDRTAHTQHTVCVNFPPPLLSDTQYILCVYTVYTQPYKRRRVGGRYHLTQAIIQHVKVGGVGGVRDLGQVGRGQLVQRAPVQVAEERMAPEVPQAPGAQPILPLADERRDEGACRVRHLGAQRRELKVVLEEAVIVMTVMGQ